MEEYEKMNEDMCEFKKYANMSLDLLTDAFKWKKLSDYSEDVDTKQKYKSVSDTLYNLFMQEHAHIGEMFKGE